VDVLLGMSDCNSTTLPCTPGMVFSKRDAPEESANNSSTEQFRSLIALANFICCWTRPDIAFIVNKLCKFMSNPGQIHVAALKHLLRYLKGTKTAGLRFNFGGKAFMNCLHAFADASFADCRDTGRSTVGYVFFYSGAVLSWHSKLHSLVTTSTTIVNMLQWHWRQRRLNGSGCSSAFWRAKNSRNQRQCSLTTRA